jgi:hypothetical protein
MSIFNKVVLVFTFLLVAWVYGRMALSNETTDEELAVQSIAQDIRRLQPKVGVNRANRLASIILSESIDHQIPSKLVVAVIMRESGYYPSIERRERFGRRGEIGLMQIMPYGAALSVRPSDCSERLESARCQIATGVAWLSYSRQMCPGSMATWLAGYNGRCLSHNDAMEEWHVRQAMRYYSLLERWGDEE